jgi:hypothetical protein
MASLVLSPCELFAVALPSSGPGTRADYAQSDAGTLIKGSESVGASTSVERIVEALDNGAALALPAGTKVVSYQ